MVSKYVWKSYLKALDNYPFLTKCLTASTLMTTGDLVAQTAIEPKKETGFDFDRSKRMAFIGLFINGPLMSFWYKFLDKNFTSVLGRLLLDQALFAPTIVSAFFTSNGLLQGNHPRDVFEKVKKDIPPAMLANWTVWPIFFRPIGKWLTQPQTPIRKKMRSWSGSGGM